MPSTRPPVHDEEATWAWLEQLGRDALGDDDLASLTWAAPGDSSKDNAADASNSKPSSSNPTSAPNKAITAMANGTCFLDEFRRQLVPFLEGEDKARARPVGKDKAGKEKQGG